MTKKLNLKYIITVCSLIIISTVAKIHAIDAPPNMAAGLTLQFLAFEKNLISTENELTIHVIGSPELADELKKSIGTKIANRTFSKVTQSNDLPTERPDVLIISNATIVSSAIEYTRKEKIVSITNKPELVEKGVSLGLGMNETGGQVVLLNISSATEEGLDWKPVILKIAKTVK